MSPAVDLEQLEARLAAAGRRYQLTLACNGRENCTAKWHLPVCPHWTEDQWSRP